VREPPLQVDSAELLEAVRAAWGYDVTRVEHLPVGFGAHHWAAYARDEPRLFVTFDRLEPKRPLADLTAAYSGAVALAEAGLDFVLAPLVGVNGSPVVAFGDGALSCTPWRDGTSEGALDVAWTSRALRRLHGVVPPDGIPRWRPLVTPDFVTEVERLLGRPWGPGPYAAGARAAVGEHLHDLEGWTTRYHALAAVAGERTWVATHGEPHSDNQLLTSRGRYLVDWESLKLAPPELDLRVLVDVGADVAADPEMLELVDLEWRLDEIDQYAAWFAAEHHGTEDDREAFGGLVHELNRP
jgi:spectinomycin phosphotransferase